MRERAYPLLKGSAEFILDYLVADKDGNALWAEMAGDEDDPQTYDEDNGTGITVDASGTCYVTGTFDGTRSLYVFSPSRKFPSESVNVLV